MAREQPGLVVLGGQVLPVVVEVTVLIISLPPLSGLCTVTE